MLLRLLLGLLIAMGNVVALILVERFADLGDDMSQRATSRMKRWYNWNEMPTAVKRWYDWQEMPAAEKRRGKRFRMQRIGGSYENVYRHRPLREFQELY